MKTCEHLETSKVTIKRELGGNSFSAEAEVCLSCNAELWDDSLRKEFSDWIGKLDPKSKPRIQFKMSRNADQCLHKIMGFFPGAVKTVVVRAMIGVYFEMMRGGSEINDLFNEFPPPPPFSFEDDSMITPQEAAERIKDLIGSRSFLVFVALVCGSARDHPHR
jgi:hypothetical protein